MQSAFQPCVGAKASVSDSKKLIKLTKKQIKTAGDCSGAPQADFAHNDLANLNTTDNTAHLLHNIVIKQQSVFSSWLPHLWCNKEQSMRSFVSIQ